MRSHGEKHPANDCRQELVRILDDSGKSSIKIKVKHRQLSTFSRRSENCRPSAAYQSVQNHEYSTCTQQVNPKLNGIGPDDGADSSDKCIDQRKESDDSDRNRVRPARDKRQGNRRHEKADTVSEDSSTEEHQ